MVVDRWRAPGTPYATLVNLIGKEKNGIVPPAIFVHGAFSCGKTWTVETFLRESGICHVEVCGSFCTDPGNLWNLALWYTHQELKAKGLLPAEFESDGGGHHFGTTKEMIAVLDKYLEAFPLGGRKFCLVLDSAEWLVKRNKFSLLNIFLRLQEILGKNVCVILVSLSPWEKFIHRRVTVAPFVVPVPQLDRDGLVEVLRKTAWVPDSFSDEVRDVFSDVVVKSLYQMTRDVRDIRKIAEEIADKCEGKWAGLEDHDSLVVKVWTDANRYLAGAIKEVHLQGETMDSVEELHWPVYAKYLLVASFLASFNSPKWDKIYFCKRHKEGKSKKRTTFARDNKYTETSGPQFASVRRIIAIFHVIYENTHQSDIWEDEEVSDSLRSDCCLLPIIATLTQGHFLARNGSLLEDPQYKCIAKTRLVKDIAKSLNLNLDMYMRHVP